jgi:hypothetical protein
LLLQIHSRSAKEDDLGDHRVTICDFLTDFIPS